MANTGIACETITSGSAQRRQPAEAANTMARAAPRTRPSSRPSDHLGGGPGGFGEQEIGALDQHREHARRRRQDVGRHAGRPDQRFPAQQQADGGDQRPHGARPRSSATRRACRPSRSGSAGSRGTTPGGSIARTGDERRARQDTDLMADAQRLQRIVGDQHGGAAGEQARREVLQLQPRHRVEMGERLVHQHDRPVLAQRAGECRALAHAAGQVRRDGRRAGRPGRPRPAARGRAASAAASAARSPRRR